jgi:hypothetical protein
MWRRYARAWIALVLGATLMALFYDLGWPTRDDTPCGTRIIVFLLVLAWPGGWLFFHIRKIERFRSEARTILGVRFDDTAFDQMLRGRTFGATLAYSVEQWIAARRSVG